MGVTALHSTREQVRVALKRVQEVGDGRRVFLFVNVSALHHPNRIYVEGATEDAPATQRAALAYADGELAALFAGLRERGSWLCVVCSDHGSAYGEDGFHGHRLAHRCVWDVPYAEFMLERAE